MSRGEPLLRVSRRTRTSPRQLARKFGTLSAEVMARLDALTASSALDALTLQVLAASSLHELGLE